MSLKTAELLVLLVMKEDDGISVRKGKVMLAVNLAAVLKTDQTIFFCFEMFKSSQKDGAGGV